jgi:trimethylamine-N-oxide reductase (cytochrome c)
MDVGTSRLAQATSANTCVVKIEGFTGEAPPVSAFGGPTVVEV